MKRRFLSIKKQAFSKSIGYCYLRQLSKVKAKWLDYGEPAATEAIGLYYAAFMFIGLALGMMKNAQISLGRDQI